MTGTGKRLKGPAGKVVQLVHGGLRGLRDLVMVPWDLRQQMAQLARGQEAQLKELAALRGGQQTLLEVVGEIRDRQQALLEAAGEIYDTQKATLGSTGMAVRQLTALGDRSGPVRVAFLVHNYEAWGALRSVFRAMEADARFAPLVFTVPRLFPGSTRYEGEADNSARLEAEGVPHIRLNDPVAIKDLNRIKSFAPEAIFRQSHWQKDLPSAFKTRNLTFARQYYVPYAIGPLSSSGGGSVSHTPKDIVQRQFVSSELVKSIMAASDRLHGARIEVTGHPKVRDILDTPPHWPIDSGNRRRVLWSAHHSINTGWNNFGTLHLIHAQMLDLARRRSDIDILFSPHPALLTRLRALKEAGRDWAERFLEDWDALPNTGIIWDGSYAGTMHASDLLIVDGLSLLIEYQLLLKPVIRLSRPDNAPFNAFGALVAEGTHELPAAGIDGIEALIDGLLDGSVPHREREQRAVRAELTPFADPAREIAETIFADLRPERGGWYAAGAHRQISAGAR